MKRFEQLCKEIDWSELAEQKKQVEIMAKHHESIVMNIFNDRDMRRRSVKKCKTFQSLSKFLGTLQDTAVELYGMPVSEVHPIMEKVVLVNQAKQHKN